MATYYRFQNDEPERGEIVCCFTSLNALKKFARQMEEDDPDDFERMKFWEIEGTFDEEDGDDAFVRVENARQIRL